MSAGQIAAIRPALQELLGAVETDPPDARDLCATFTVPGRESAWVQVVLGTVNFGFPHSTDPSAMLATAGLGMPPGSVVSAWEACKFATVEHGPCSKAQLAAFVDDLFVRVQGMAPDYPIDVALERL